MPNPGDKAKKGGTAAGPDEHNSTIEPWAASGNAKLTLGYSDNQEDLFLPQSSRLGVVLEFRFAHSRWYGASSIEHRA